MVVTSSRAGYVSRVLLDGDFVQRYMRRSKQFLGVMEKVEVARGLGNGSVTLLSVRMRVFLEAVLGLFDLLLVKQFKQTIQTCLLDD
jgi:hypothetical protein